VRYKDVVHLAENRCKLAFSTCAYTVGLRGGETKHSFGKGFFDS
jgi:hypothetical protein